MFASIGMSAGIFGNESPNYWRECSAGLQTVPYFLARWFASIPKICLAALLFFVAFALGFNNIGSS